MKKERILGEDSVLKIEEKIRDVEKTTSGEIVVAVTPASSRYLDIGISVSAFLSLLSSYICIRIIPQSDSGLLSSIHADYLPEVMLSLFLIFFFVFNLLFFLFPSLKFLFLSSGM